FFRILHSPSVQLTTLNRAPRLCGASSHVKCHLTAEIDHQALTDLRINTWSCYPTPAGSVVGSKKLFSTWLSTMTFTANSTLIYVLVSVCAWAVYLKFKCPRNLPPGPKGYPFVGNLFQLDANRPWHSLGKWKKTYGDIVYIRLFNQDVIVLNSAKAAGDLLDRRAANYSQRPRIPVIECLTGGLSIGFMDHGS
ncbi:cytochrome p450, partial [Moniliophthora roreri]